MLDIPEQSKEGLQQLAIDIKTKLQHKPLNQAPQVLKQPEISIINTIKVIMYVFICGMVAGVGYLLITNPAGFISWFVGVWEKVVGVLH